MDKRNYKCKTAIQKSFAVHNTPKSNPLFSDENEFPSLAEIAGKPSIDFCSLEKKIKYSDKLKSTCVTQGSHSETFDIKNNKYTSSKTKNKTLDVSKSELTNRHHCSNNQILNCKKTSHDSPNAIKTEFVDLKKGSCCSMKNCDKSSLNQSLKQTTNINESLKISEKRILPSNRNNLKQSSFNSNRNTSSGISNVKHRHNISQPESSASSEFNTKLMCKSLLEDNNKLKNEEENEDTQYCAKAKKKKNRKSKIKRQVAFQSGKITVLTPEVHSKILNQSSTPNFPNVTSIITDINDEDEYPELGKSFALTSQKENSLKKVEKSHVKSENKAFEKPLDTFIQELAAAKEIAKEPNQNFVPNEKYKADKKVKSDNKAVHPYEPITISIFDILAKDCKVKGKDLKDEINIPINNELKMKPKKDSCHPHNLLDSSSPAVKRGKEREKPKVKRPSHLKKIILLDRKVRKEQVLQMRNSAGKDEEIAQNGHVSHTSANCMDEIQEACTLNEKLSVSENTSENTCLDTLATLHLKKPDEINSVFSFQSFGEENNQSVCDDYIFHTKDHESFEAVEKEILEDSLNKSSFTNYINETDAKEYSIQNTAVNVFIKEELNFDSNENGMIDVETSDSLPKLESDNFKQVEISDRGRASKIILHTRNFREYCNHLISKEIDDSAYALLDDLARFRDRMHQKDPVKARMKRRMVYGIKEIKKHIKLRKLKCIIIAPDIENVETEGGLNDILKEIKLLAADHHIPCIFALGRKILGKVLHKPVPVSCVGVFNYEGSEVNFKKMIELQTQSVKDYADVLDKLANKITNEQIAIVIKAKKEAPENLHNLRSQLLREIFLPSAADSGIHEDVKPKSFHETSDLSEAEL